MRDRTPTRALENGALPKNANTYTATLHAGDESVSVNYTINKADLTVKAKDATIVYGDTAVSNGVTYNGFVNDEDESVLGGSLTYTFVESVKATFPFYVIRLVGGLLYLTGMLVMLWNTVMTARQGRAVDGPVIAVNPAHA